MHNQDAVNDYLAKISSKEEYNSSELDRFHCEGSTESYQPLYNYEVERLLSISLDLLQPGVMEYLHGCYVAVLLSLQTL